MKVYIYASSGHNFGLENVRRCSAIFKELKEFEPTLATADYRAATFAKNELGVTCGLGVDVIGNLPHMMERGDILIYDSYEPSSTMTEHMEDFCSLLYKVDKDISVEIVDSDFFKKKEIKREKVFFFADDDYKDELLRLCNGYETQELPLLWGHYFFLGNEDKLAPYFNEIIEEEEYKQTIQTTKYLLTSSVHTVFESLASGNYPVFYKRMDKQIANEELLSKYNIPIITGDNISEIYSNFDKICNSYPKVKTIKKVNLVDIKQNILKVVERFKHIQPSLDYK